MQDYKQVPWAPTDIDAGAGAVFSNVLDYVKQLRMMMHRALPIISKWTRGTHHGLDHD